MSQLYFNEMKFKLKQLDKLKQTFKKLDNRFQHEVQHKISRMIKLPLTPIQDEQHSFISSYQQISTPSRSISSTSKHSSDNLSILNQIYPSIENEYLLDTPLAFLGSDQFLHIDIDWKHMSYPLTSFHIEIFIDLIQTRPSFIREIPRVTNFTLYKPINKIISGRLFFDYGMNKSCVHRCHRKEKNFQLKDLILIHQREFLIINSNVRYEQRFINLYENLFQIHVYQTKSL